MKVLLINPPVENIITTNIPIFDAQQERAQQPLGLLYVAAYLKRHSSHQVRVLDCIVEGMGADGVREYIREFRPEVIGIQAMTFTMIDVYNLAKAIKEIDRSIIVVLGGPHVNIYPEETIALPEIDFLVLGEGEVTFTELMENLHHPDKLVSVKGMVFKEGSRIVNTGVRPLIESLDELPFPSRSLVPYKKYYSVVSKKSLITTIMTSRGCPYRCLFCARTHLGTTFRPRSPENVVDEIQQCLEMGIEEFFFYDDTFAVDRKRAMDICDEIIRRRLNIRWNVRTHLNTVNEELLKKLKKANCTTINYGVEAGTDQILKVLKKQVRVDKVKQVFKMTNNCGIEGIAYFMIGSPTETKTQILQSIKLAKALRPSFAHFAIFTPFPNTDAYRLGLEKGLYKSDYWKEFAKNPTSNFVPEVWNENFSRKELEELLVYAYRNFYFQPRYVFRKLFNPSTYKNFSKKAKVVLQMLKS